MTDKLKTRVIAVGNQKGGVGKTTNTVHLARALVELGRKVLIIDLDMNHSATRHLGIEPEAFMGSFEMLVGDEPAINLVVSSDDEDTQIPEGLDIIPAARKLEGIDQAVMSKSKFVTPKEVLKNPLDSLRGRYDYIFLDTAPNATLPTLAAYMTADYFILSAMPDPFAIAGLNDAMRDVMDARQKGNPKLAILGVIVSGVDKRTSLANALSDFVEQSFRLDAEGESVKFRTSIGRSTVIPLAQKVGRTVFETNSQHKLTDQYRALAREVEARLAKLERQSDDGVDEHFAKVGNG
ncbi:MAG: ParA family protein [Armatimonadetes bacterium]|nr:ParA family protein [Armatimonadota bacterium]